MNYRNRRIAITLAALALALTGCGGNADHDLLDLRDAAVDAGYTCPNWRTHEDGDVGYCTDADVFAVYADKSALNAGLAKHLDTLSTFGFEATILVGDNWWIDGPKADLEHIADDLGGEIRTTN
jgi:hypothetical protein